MDVVVYPSKEFGKQVKRLSELNAPFVVRVPAGEKQKDILTALLPMILEEDGLRVRWKFGAVLQTLRVFGFYSAAAGAAGKRYEMSYRDERDLLVTFTPTRKSGVVRYEDGDFEGAIAAFYEEASAGSNSARVWLGYMHETGKGVSPDQEKAEWYYRDAGGAGSDMGWYYLGNLLLRSGRTSEAVDAFERSASRGFAPSLYRLAQLYSWGKGVPKNDATAGGCYRKAAEHGNLWAQRWVVWQEIRCARGVFQRMSALRALGAFYIEATGVIRKDMHDIRLLR
jgi:TPR repeat protein